MLIDNGGLESAMENIIGIRQFFILSASSKTFRCGSAPTSLEAPIASPQVTLSLSIFNTLPRLAAPSQLSPSYHAFAAPSPHYLLTPFHTLSSTCRQYLAKKKNDAVSGDSGSEGRSKQRVRWIDETRAPFSTYSFEGAKRPKGWLYQQVGLNDG